MKKPVLQEAVAKTPTVPPPAEEGTVLLPGARETETPRAMPSALAYIAHELRAALAIIGGRVDLALLKPRDVAYYEKSFTDVKRHIHDMRLLLDASMELAKLEALAKPFHGANIQDLAIIAETVAEDMDAQFGAEEKTLERDLKSACLPGEKMLLVRVVANLIDNGRKFSPPGKVVKLRTWTEKGHALVQVEDKGRGMTPEEIEHCTERFWRAAGSGVSGHGLGLALVQRIVELHEGEMRIVSALGEGTNITVSFPVPKKASRGKKRGT